jgi:glycosyltransferase involved in cell wall biosynthesis
MCIGLRRYLVATNPAVLMASLTGTNLVACFTVGLVAPRLRLIIREANTSTNRRRALSSHACKLLYRRADAFIGNSVGVVNDLVCDLGVDKRKVYLIHNPIDLEHVRREALGPCPHPWFNDCGPPVLLGMGRLTKQKGFDVLLRALASLLQRRAVRLVILGEGPERPTLEALALELGIQENVRMPGFRANPYPWLGRCDVFCLSSRWEGFPQALVEALGIGCQIVASDCHSGPKEMLENGRLGLLVPVGDHLRFATGIERMLALEGVNYAGRERAQEYSLSRQADRYLSVLVPQLPRFEA